MFRGQILLHPTVVGSTEKIDYELTLDGGGGESFTLRIPSLPRRNFTEEERETYRNARLDVLLDVLTRNPTLWQGAKPLQGRGLLKEMEDHIFRLEDAIDWYRLSTLAVFLNTLLEMNDEYAIRRTLSGGSTADMTDLMSRLRALY